MTDRTCREIREEAWRLLWNGKWVWKLLGVWAIGYIFADVVQSLVSAGFRIAGVWDWQRYFMVDALNKAVNNPELSAQLEQFGLNDIDRVLTVPDINEPGVSAAITGGTVFKMMIGWWTAAFSVYALNSAWLSAVRGEGEWFKRAMGAFRHFSSMAWLYILWWGAVLGGLILFIAPGWYLSYAFQQAFFLKTDNPDWSAVKCLTESNRMMKGHKRKAFALDWSYYKSVTWMLVPFLVAEFVIFPVVFLPVPLWATLLLPPLALLLVLLGIFLCWFTHEYISVGQAVFYRDLRKSLVETSSN